MSKPGDTEVQEEALKGAETGCVALSGWALFAKRRGAVRARAPGISCPPGGNLQRLSLVMLIFRPMRLMS